MRAQKPKRRHHYIPVFYLNGFTNKNRILFVYDKDRNPVFESSPEGVAYENHYFSFTTPGGERDSETVENNMMLLEGKFSEVIRKIHEDENLDQDDQVTFAFLVASMMARVPNMRNNIRKATGAAMKLINVRMSSNQGQFRRMVEKVERDTGKQIGMDVEELRQWANNPGNYDVTVDKEYAAGMALSLLKDFANVFFQMKWAFLRATEDYKFVTGDNPLRYIDPTHDPRSFHGVGLANKNIEVSLPLSKEICAFGSWKSIGRYIRVNSGQVKHLNKMTVTASERFVFADTKSEILDKFVKKYKGSHPVMVVG